MSASPSRRALSAGIVFSAVLFLRATNPVCTAAQYPELDSLASQMADAISVPARTVQSRPSAIVKPFKRVHATEPTMLTAELAHQLEKALAATASNFDVTDDEAYTQTFHVTQTGDTSQSGTDEDCRSDVAKPRFIIDGYVDELTDGDDRVVVRVTIVDAAYDQIIFDRRTSLPMTAEMKSLANKKLEEKLLPPSSGRVVWDRPGVDIPAAIASVPAHPPDSHDVSLPQCGHCPRTEYPDSAVRAKIQGSLTLKVLADAGGQPIRIIVLKGLPCGLTEAAIQSVSSWKMEPAKDSAGNPVPAWFVEEESFSLY